MGHIFTSIPSLNSIVNISLMCCLAQLNQIKCNFYSSKLQNTLDKGLYNLYNTVALKCKTPQHFTKHYSISENTTAFHKTSPHFTKRRGISENAVAFQKTQQHFTKHNSISQNPQHFTKRHSISHWTERVFL